MLHLLQILENVNVQDNTWLVTIDIEVLYSSIPYQIGHTTVSKFLSERERIFWPRNQFVLTLLSHVLHNNIFCFNGIFYHQRQEVAVGAKCAPSYANLLLGGWERDMFANEGLPMYLCQILCWHRYIDDAFVLWTGNISSLHYFIQKLNVNSYNLSFTYAFDQSKISFLYLLIFKDNSIPNVQFLCIRNNCSTISSFKEEGNGYSKKSLKRAYNREVTHDRTALLFKPKSSKQEDQVRFITQYTYGHQKVRNILCRYWHLLSNDNTISTFITTQPSLVFKHS